MAPRLPVPNSLSDAPIDPGPTSTTRSTRPNAHNKGGPIIPKYHFASNIITLENCVKATPGTSHKTPSSNEGPDRQQVPGGWRTAGGLWPPETQTEAAPDNGNARCSIVGLVGFLLSLIQQNGTLIRRLNIDFVFLIIGQTKLHNF